MTRSQAFKQRGGFWSDPPTSPFADNSELVKASSHELATSAKARAVANEALLRTKPPGLDQTLMLPSGMAAVLIADGKFEDASHIACWMARYGTVAPLGALEQPPTGATNRCFVPVGGAPR